MLGGGLPATVADCPWQQTSIVRMNPLIRPVIDGSGSWAYPDKLPQDDTTPQEAPGKWTAEEFAALAGMDLAVTDPAAIQSIADFCAGWMQDKWTNQPIRHGSDGSATAPNVNFCEIGHATYSLAKAAW
jgi:hypothetical protein